MKFKLFESIIIKLLLLLVIDFANAQIPYDHSGSFIELKSGIIDVDVDIYDPRSLEISDNFLIVTDASNLPSVHVFTIAKPGILEYKIGFGNEGRGPAEFVGAWDIIKSPDYIYIYDAGTRRLLPYDMEFNHNPRGIVNLRTEGLPINLHFLNDKFYVTGITIDGRVEIINRSGETIDKLYEHHDLELRERINSRALASMWHSYSTLSPDGGRIALFARNAAHAELLTIDGEQLSIIKDSDKGLPITQVVGQTVADGPGAIRGYISVTSDNKYIYALYSGYKVGESNSPYGGYIHKFDWDLNLIDIFELDHKALSILRDNDKGIYTIQHYPDVLIRYIELDN